MMTGGNNNKAILYRILIIEDEPRWFEYMEEALRDFSNEYGISIDAQLAQNCEQARQLMGNILFHAAAIDLRLPEKAGGVMTSTPLGLELAISQARLMPMVKTHLFTAWAKEHVLDLYRRSARDEAAPLVWEKAVSDGEGDDCYTQSEWAERILALVLPRNAALEIALVKQRSELQAYLQCLSPFGEGMDYAVSAGCKHLPGCLAKSCALLHHWLASGERQHEWQAYQEALFLAEMLQHWLWVQAAAWLEAMSMPTQVCWPYQEAHSSAGCCAGLETALQNMLAVIAGSEHAAWAAAWLSHLHYPGNGQTLNIIDALTAIRGFRAEQDVQELPWERLALPLRVVLDAAEFLASHPVLASPHHAPDGRWSFTVFKGETTPFPEDEWSLMGELGHTRKFSPIDDTHLYQLWPVPDGGYALLNLWPFAEQRSIKGEDRAVWLACDMAIDDSHQPKRLWVRNAVDGQYQCVDDANDKRLVRLVALCSGHAKE